jgi:hypothetical protein
VRPRAFCSGFVIPPGEPHEMPQSSHCIAENRHACRWTALVCRQKRESGCQQVGFRAGSLRYNHGSTRCFAPVERRAHAAIVCGAIISDSDTVRAY